MQGWKVVVGGILTVFFWMGALPVYADRGTHHPGGPPPNPVCVAQCRAANGFCELQSWVAIDQGIGGCVTEGSVPGVCSALVDAAHAACPTPVVDAAACTTAVRAAQQCLEHCAESLETETCDSAFALCLKGC